MAGQILPGNCVSAGAGRHRSASGYRHRAAHAVLAPERRQELPCRRTGSGACGRRCSRSSATASSRTAPPPTSTSSPQFQVTLNRRQHVRVNVGLQIPAIEPRRPIEAVRLLSAVGLVRRRVPGGMAMSPSHASRCRSSLPLARDRVRAPDAEHRRRSSRPRTAASPATTAC